MPRVAPKVDYKLRMKPELYQILRRHAFERDVSTSRLINDILQFWAYISTPVDDPMFDPAVTGVPRPAPPVEIRPGYFNTLGFMDDDQLPPISEREGHWRQEITPDWLSRRNVKSSS
jgi:hypothetical protein